MASSVFLSPERRQGIQASINKFDMRNIVFGGEFDWNTCYMLFKQNVSTCKK